MSDFHTFLSLCFDREMKLNNFSPSRAVLHDIFLAYYFDVRSNLNALCLENTKLTFIDSTMPLNPRWVYYKAEYYPIINFEQGIFEGTNLYSLPIQEEIKESFLEVLAMLSKMRKTCNKVNQCIVASNLKGIKNLNQLLSNTEGKLSKSIVEYLKFAEAYKLIHPECVAYE